MELNQLTQNNDYKTWLTALKQKFRSTQLKAAVAVNHSLLQFYWELGADIIARQETHAWGEGFLPQLSRDLTAAFPDMKGFSPRNLASIRQWHLFYRSTILLQPVAKLQALIQIPWGHHQTILNKCKKIDEALYYVNSVSQHNWSRSVLTHQKGNGDE
jgi:predicted nuclease of restriction endonuclease-like (RecB) superfamily